MDEVADGVPSESIQTAAAEAGAAVAVAIIAATAEAEAEAAQAASIESAETDARLAVEAAGRASETAATAANIASDEAVAAGNFREEVRAWMTATDSRLAGLESSASPLTMNPSDLTPETPASQQVVTVEMETPKPAAGDADGGGGQPSSRQASRRGLRIFR